MRRFGELEAVIMDRLWQLGRSALVREMVDDLLEDRALSRLHSRPAQRWPAMPGRTAV